MNAIVTVSAALVPASMTEAMKLAEMMASAKLVPKDLQKSPADCLMVIQQAVRWQMDPFAVAQECSVIQGKLMHSGKLVAAVVNARGNLAERLSFTYTGENGDRKITVSGKLQGEKDVRSVEVRLGDAKTNNRVWQSQPDQQLMYHGCRVWARRHTPELMLGVWSPEEFDETANGNGNNAQPVVIEHQPEPAAGKRTMAEISANKRRRETECKEIGHDLQGIASREELEEYKATKLTEEFMHSLGNAQYAVEEMVAKREEELAAEEPVTLTDAQWLEAMQSAASKDALLKVGADIEAAGDEERVERLLPAFKERMKTLKAAHA